MLAEGRDWRLEGPKAKDSAETAAGEEASPVRARYRPRAMQEAEATVARRTGRMQDERLREDTVDRCSRPAARS